jgi:putative MFS transporter
MTAAEHGLVSAATLFGILVGAIGLGGLADYFGRKLLFIGEMIIFVVFLVLLTASPSLPWLIVFLFGIGLALGCDYPTAHRLLWVMTTRKILQLHPS